MFFVNCFRAEQFCQNNRNNSGFFNAVNNIVSIGRDHLQSFKKKKDVEKKLSQGWANGYILDFKRIGHPDDSYAWNALGLPNGESQ